MTEGVPVEVGQVLVVLESMKMEVSIASGRSGIVREIRCAEGRPVQAGEVLIVIEPTP